MSTTIELDYMAMTEGERLAVIAAFEGLGVTWRHIPVRVAIRYNTVAELILVPVFATPRRLTSDGEMVMHGEVVEITDANRWAVIFLLAIADRLGLGGWDAAYALIEEAIEDGRIEPDPEGQRQHRPNCTKFDRPVDGHELECGCWCHKQANTLTAPYPTDVPGGAA